MINTSYINPTTQYKKYDSVKPQQPTVNITDTPKYTKSVYNDSGIIHTSWFYVNDIHGKMTKMERVYKMSQDFDNMSATKQHNTFFSNTTDDKVNKFKVASGDISIGANYSNNKVASKFLDWCGFIASAIGNHELDVVEPDNLAKLLEDSNCKMLALNIEAKKGSPLDGRFEKSIIVDKNGEKFGIIGIAPSDMFDRVKMNDTMQSIEVKNIAETTKLVQQEVDKLKQQGINKIILLSHSGLNNDKKLAKQTDGIDIIFSAHTHELIKGINEGKNLLYSKSGEPVILTEAGKNGEYVGILNVDFDKNGVITKAQNNIISTAPYNRPLYVKDSVEKIIGKPEVVGRVAKTVPLPKNILIEENPHGNLIVDAMKNELGTDIALLNAGNIRGAFTLGDVDSRLVADITPFEDKMMILNLTEKQIVDAIKVGCKSIPKNTKPGILFISGMRYTANKKGELVNLEYLDKEGKTHEIDVNNPREDKKYTVAADDFFAMGGDNYLPTNPNPDFVLQTFDLDKNKLACDYIKKLPQPMEIKPDGRVKIID